MRTLILFIFCFLLTACSGGGSKDAPTPPPIKVVKQPPTLTITVPDNAQSGAIIQITTSISDPDSTQFTLDWQANHDGVIFTSVSQTQTQVQLPQSSEELNIELSLTVKDESNLSAKQSANLRLMPSEPIQKDIVITLPSTYTVAANQYVTLAVSAQSDEPIRDIKWQLPQALEIDTESQNDFNDTNAQSTLTLLAPDLQQTTAFTIKVTVSTDSGYKTVQTQLSVKVEDSETPYLTVNTPPSVTADEGTSVHINATIQSSAQTPTIKWQWLSDTNIALSNANTAQVMFEAPQVNQDTQLQLGLTVTAGELSETRTIDILIKKSVIDFDLSLQSNRSSAVKGQTVTFLAQTTQADLINSDNWHVTELDASQYQVIDNKLIITAPEVSQSAYQDIVVTYTASLNNNQDVSRSASVRFLNGSQLFTQLGFTVPEQAIAIYNNEQINFNVPVTGNIALIDTLTVDMSLSIFGFSQSEAKLEQDQASITLLSDKIIEEKQTYAEIIAHAGDYSVSAMIPIHLHPSHYKVYAGIKESYIAGSTISLFGLIFHNNVPVTNLAGHQFAWLDNGRGSFTERDNLITNYTSSKYINTATDLTLTHQKDAITTESIVTHDWTIFTSQNQGNMNCFKGSQSIKCLFNGLEVPFSIDTTTPKQFVISDNFACLINNQEEFDCVGDPTHTVIQQTAVANNIARVNLIDKNAVCIQNVTGQWQCSGNNKNHFMSLIGQFNQVYHIASKNNATCLVADGFMRCFNNDANLIFEDKTDTVAEVKIVAGSMCYYRSSNSTTSLQCPTLTTY